MTIDEALRFGQRELRQAADPRLDARLLLEHALGVGHGYLITHHQDCLEAGQEEQYRALVARAARKEPIPYIIGEAPFYGRFFYVNHAVLIPRPETELLIEEALAFARSRPAGAAAPLVVDVGTGTGCLAITLALLLPEARLEATDISALALDVARRNAARHEADGRVRFHLGSLLSPIDGRPDLIVANLPYVADDEWTGLSDGVKWYEPPLALRGGPDGLEIIRQLLEQAERLLAPGGAVCLEIGWQQGRATGRLARDIFAGAQVTVRADYSGLDRVVTIQT